MSTTTYRITVLGFALDTRECPPAMLKAVFPSAPEPEHVHLSADECLVTFATPQAPADLGPLVKVELVTSE
jgi:hypothetical protein